jgi:hypothetical protein
MAAGSRGLTNVLLAVIGLLLVLILLYLLGVIGPRAAQEEAEFRIETPEGEAEIDVD